MRKGEVSHAAFEEHAETLIGGSMNTILIVSQNAPKSGSLGFSPTAPFSIHEIQRQGHYIAGFLART